MDRRVALGVIAGATALGALIYLFRTREEDVLARRLRELGEVAEFPVAGESASGRAARVTRALDELILPDAVIRAPELSGERQSRAGLIALAVELPALVETAELTFEHVEVRFAARRDAARVQADAVLTFTDATGAYRERRQVVCRFVAAGGAWRVAGLEVSPAEDLPPEARP